MSTPQLAEISINNDGIKANQPESVAPIAIEPETKLESDKQIVLSETKPNPASNVPRKPVLSFSKPRIFKTDPSRAANLATPGKPQDKKVETDGVGIKEVTKNKSGVKKENVDNKSWWDRSAKLKPSIESASSPSQPAKRSKTVDMCVLTIYSVILGASTPATTLLSSSPGDDIPKKSPVGANLSHHNLKKTKAALQEASQQPKIISELKRLNTSTPIKVKSSEGLDLTLVDEGQKLLVGEKDHLISIDLDHQSMQKKVKMVSLRYGEEEAVKKHREQLAPEPALALEGDVTGVQTEVITEPSLTVSTSFAPFQQLIALTSLASPGGLIGTAAEKTGTFDVLADATERLVGASDHGLSPPTDRISVYCCEPLHPLASYQDSQTMSMDQTGSAMRSCSRLVQSRI
jgi:hypothetical protein